MYQINCPHCNKPVQVIISNALDEEGEVFMCPNCKNKFRYASNG